VTDISFRDYFDQRIDDLDRRVADRFTLSDQAVAKAERTMNDRLNSMNEFRDALRDQANRMATRTEMENLEAQVNELRRVAANFDGRVAMAAALISVLTSVVVGWIVSVLKT